MLRLLGVLVRLVGRASKNIRRSNQTLSINPAYPDGLAIMPPEDGVKAGDREGGSPPAKPTGMITPLPQGTPLVRNGMRLRRDEPGRAAAHRDMGVRHSLSLWVR